LPLAPGPAANTLIAMAPTAVHDNAILGGLRLPADLAKLCTRFLAEYPEESARVIMMAQVPAVLRHVLSLRLELDRVDTLPRRYRQLAIRTLHAGAPSTNPDAVEQLVVRYSLAVRQGKLRESDALRPQLLRFFTQPQLVELVFALTQGQAFAMFDAMLKV
jgi:hypothetical protein